MPRARKRLTSSPEPQVALAAGNAWKYKLWNYAHVASGGRWYPFAALRFIADIAQEAIRRGDGRVIINIPPRHGKTVLMSQWLPCWFLDWYPEREVIVTAYGARHAAKNSRIVRDYFRAASNAWAQLSSKQDANEWMTILGGGMRAAGAAGPILGFGSDLFLIDDPHKSQAETQSVLHREKIIDWFNSDVYSRLEPGATVILIMQRMHEEDLTGYLLREHGDEWTHVNLPGIAREDDILGRAPGEALIPERYDEERLAKIRRAVGPIFWAGRYDQNPAPAEGNIVKRDWIRYYKALPPKISRVTNTWDMSFKKTGRSWCVGQTWCQKGSHHYLLDEVRGKWDFTKALHEVVGLHSRATERWGTVHKTLVEEAANGHGIISALKGRLPRIKAVKVSTSKIERMSNAAPSFECGDVYVPHETVAEFPVRDTVEEWVVFPNGANDDRCDSMSQYINSEQGKPVGRIDLNLEVGRGAPEWRL